jgi:hypothetical protein
MLCIRDRPKLRMEPVRNFFALAMGVFIGHSQ